MRCLIAFLISVQLLVPASAAPSPVDQRPSAEAVQTWIFGYRAKPDLSRVPGAYRALAQLGLLKDPEQSGIYVGFLAGIIGTNPTRAEELIGKTLPVVGSDQWAIVRAIAYSGPAGLEGAPRQGCGPHADAERHDRDLPRGRPPHPA